MRNYHHEFDYMPSHFYHWNEDKQFKAAVFYLKVNQPKIKALMLHSCKGSIRDNEDMQDALEMDKQEIILSELHAIKELSVNQAKKQFVNHITKVNPVWYKDVRMMMKFLENPDKIYNPKDEDYKQLISLESDDIIRQDLKTPLSQGGIDNSDSEIYQMNRSIRRDYIKMTDHAADNQHHFKSEENRQSLMTKRTHHQQSQPEIAAIFKLLADNKNQLFTKVLKNRQGNSQKQMPEERNRAMSSSHSERFLLGTAHSGLRNQSEKEVTPFDEASQRSNIFTSRRHLYDNQQSFGGNFNLKAMTSAQTPSYTHREKINLNKDFEERIKTGQPLKSTRELMKFNKQELFKKEQAKQQIHFSETQSSDQNEYYFNQIVEKAINKDMKNYQDNKQKEKMNKLSINQLQHQPIPIRFSGDMLMEKAQKSMIMDELQNMNSLIQNLNGMLQNKQLQEQRIHQIKKATSVENLDLDQINEELAKDCTQFDKIINLFLSQKSQIHKQESQFLSQFYDMMRGTISLVQQLNWKFRETQEKINIGNQKLKDQVQSFIEALQIIKDFKGMQDYDLFGKGKITEEQLMNLFHQTNCALKISDEPLAIKQAKLLEQYYDFIHNQENKILNGKKKIQDLEAELEHHRRKAQEQLSKAYVDNQEICKLSDALKEKIEQTNFQQDNHLETLYHSRQKILNDELEKETKEKQSALDRLRKKKEDLRKIREQLQKITSKKSQDQQVQCNLEKEEKMKYHSRPKPPVTKMLTIFDEVIHGTSTKKIPTSKLESKVQGGSTNNLSASSKAIISSGAKAVVQSKEWVQALINLIYIDKIKTDMEEFKEGKPIQSLREFVIQWFLVKFGIKKVAEALLQDFIRSLINYEPIHERFRTFLIFCGVHVQKGLNRNRDKKSDLLYEKQLESIDTFRIYLKLAHTLRNACTPFLPDINCEGQQRLPNGVVINYQESKQIFLQIMTEEGVNTSEHFTNLDIPFQEFLEDQIQYGDNKVKGKQSYMQQQSQSMKTGGQFSGMPKKHQADDKYINIDVFLRICIMEYVKIRLNQVDQILSALKILEFNNYCDILYNDFESSVKISLYNKSEKWIEGAYSYLINNLEDSYFTREDVVITMLPWIHSTAFVKDYTNKHKAWIYVKELEKMNVIEPTWNSGPQEEKKSQNQSMMSMSNKVAQKQGTQQTVNLNNNNTPASITNLKPNPNGLVAGMTRITIPKSIVPGTKMLKDPLSSAFILEKNFKIMASFFSSVESDLKEINQLYNLVMEKVTFTRKSFINQVENMDAPAQDEGAQKSEAQMTYLTGNSKFIKTCMVISQTGLTEQQDQTNDGWSLFRKLLYLVVSRHKNIDI